MTPISENKHSDSTVVWSCQSSTFEVHRPLNHKFDTKYPGVDFKTISVTGQNLVLHEFHNVELLWYNYGIYALDATGKPIEELCYLFGDRPSIEKLRELPCVDLFGVTASIMHWVPANYCHLLYEHMPLIQALDEAAQLGRIDQLLCDGWMLRFFDTLKKVYNVNMNAFGATAKGRVRCEVLLAFEPVRHPAHWGHDVMSRFFDRVRQAACPCAPHRQLIVTRPTGQRGFTNLQELQQALPDFETVSFDVPMSLLAQAKAFAEAKIVICGHGAALTNLVFMRPSTSVIEVFNKNYGMASFWVPAGARGLRYFATIDPHGPEDFYELGKISDMEIDISAVLQCVQMAEKL